MWISSNAFLLDTHAVLWSPYEPDQLSRAAREAIEDRTSILHFSEANLWELLDKASKGRLPQIGTSAARIVERVKALGVGLLPVTQADIVDAVSLPLHHGDPFDRMLIAQAIRYKLTVISKDTILSLYGVPLLW